MAVPPLTPEPAGVDVWAAGRAASPVEPAFGTGLLQRTVAHLRNGHDVIVINPLGGGPVLDLVAIALGARRCRVLRATGAVHGGLESLVGQIAGEPGASPQRAFDLLTTLGAGIDRVVLLVAQAHLLGHTEYRFLDRAAKAGPLQFVLAGPVDPVSHLDGDLAPLHNRVAAFHPLVMEPGTPLAVMVPPTPLPAPRSRAARPAAAGPVPAAAPPARVRVRTHLTAATMLAGAVAVVVSVLRHGGDVPPAPPVTVAARSAPKSGHLASAMPAVPLRVDIPDAPAKPPEVAPQAAAPPVQARPAVRAKARHSQLAVR